jgi:hypothetical protein
MLVWKAMLSITPMMSRMRSDDDWMPCMVSTTRPMTSPPCTAAAALLTGHPGGLLGMAGGVAARWPPPASIDDADACSRADVCSVRCDRSCAPAAICVLALTRLSALAHLADDGAQRVLHGAQFVHQAGRLVAAPGRGRGGQVAAGHRAQVALHLEPGRRTSRGRSSNR